ncbi:hypothetical protein LDO26_00695 [Luteimonas sp. BDR2-5]|uniref:DUF6624 domain-containing protein n=1 Tax=Proluteimonas luteida TaxID=2878685 RepID=UPI001E4FF66C|nr:DUF6624 domain-containing protein [Luteimonas sp. BDR2-5]MCD9026732.1 hypothetical protein [Luteimonas sp. BDR2-5]
MALLIAGTLVPAWAAPPELLDSVPVNEPVDLSSLDWIAPRFSANATERTKWQALLDWTAEVAQAQTNTLRESFEAKGVDASALPEHCYSDERCFLIRAADDVASRFESWTEFKAAASAAQPYVQSVRQAVEVVSDIHAPRDDATASAALAKELLRRFTNDQLMRNITAELPGGMEGTPQEQAYELYAFALEMDGLRDDARNIAYASDLIRQRGGWPAPPDVSEDSQEHLWALVQHGDQRPDLQHEALLAMEARFAGQDPRPQQYGYLYDRIMLKLTGKQRYGTQVRCVDGERQPQPLDETAPIDELRAKVGLRSMEAYLARFPDCSVAQ